MSGATGGWAGRILRVDLTAASLGSVATAPYLPDYVGGKGIATRIAWDELEPGTGPYSPENLLMFMTGPFSGTLAPTSGKGTVCSVSPRTLPDPWFTYSGMGGNWTPELKYAGFDGIVVRGAADEPLYLWIEDGRAELRPAADLWGKDVFAVQELLKERHGEAAQVICIGPAGEHRVVSATIHHRQKNCAGMAGFGAVMGAKNLKAIVIRGTGAVQIADPQRFVEACKRVHRLVHAGPTETPVRMKMGPTNIPCAHACPFGCATRSHDVALRLRGGKEKRKNISVMCNGEAYEGGWNWYQYPTPAIEEQYAGELRTRAVEGLGKQGGDELQLLIETLGLSGWSYLTLRCWFLACLDHGVGEIEGLELRPEELDFWLELFRMIAYREGLGDLLADGLLPACDRLELARRREEDRALARADVGVPVAPRRSRLRAAAQSPVDLRHAALGDRLERPPRVAPPDRVHPLLVPSALRGRLPARRPGQARGDVHQGLRRPGDPRARVRAPRRQDPGHQVVRRPRPGQGLPAAVRLGLPPGAQRLRLGAGARSRRRLLRRRRRRGLHAGPAHRAGHHHRGPRPRGRADPQPRPRAPDPQQRPLARGRHHGGVGLRVPGEVRRHAARSRDVRPDPRQLLRPPRLGPRDRLADASQARGSSGCPDVADALELLSETGSSEAGDARPRPEERE